MACYHPVLCGVKNNRRGQPRWGNNAYLGMLVGCGHCLGCRSDQARDWSLRLSHEAQMHDSNWFITLTYDNERIPENGSLSPKDLRRFFKTMRRNESGPFSYYAVGEYGGRTKRPHYHAVLCGIDFLDRYRLPDRDGNPVWQSETLASYWPHGISDFSLVTRGSASYVAGYVQKKIHKKANPDAYVRVDDETGELFDIHEEFARMSRRPAIGKRWIRKFWRDVYPRDKVIIDGKEYPPPRYYDRWMEQNHPEVLEEVKLSRWERMEEIAQKKLDAKEAIHRARSALYEERAKI